MRYQAYSEYKDSGVEWLGEIPVSWIALSVKRMSEIFNGATPKSGERTYWDGDISWVTPADLGKTNLPYISEGARSITPSGYESCGTSLVPEGTIVLSSRAPIGTLGIAAKKLCTNQGCKSLVVEKQHNSKYLYYVLLSSTAQLNLLGRGTTFLELSSDALGSYKIGMPSKAEQEVIANFLDHETAKIDTLIEKQQQLIKLLKEKRQAVISHAVTKGLDPNAPMRDSGVEWLGEVPEHWAVWKFSHIAPIITCGVASTPTYVEEEEGMPFLSAQNVRGNKLSLHKYNYIPHELHEQLTRYRRPERGDLLVTRVGAGIGDACIVDTEMEFSIYVSLTHIRVIPSIAVNRFIMYFFGSDYCKFLNYQGTVTGGGVGNLNVQNVVRYKIPLPNLEEQNHIVRFLDAQGEKFEELIGKAEEAIALAKERRTALISAAVTGKIDVRQWQAPMDSCLRGNDGEGGEIAREAVA